MRRNRNETELIAAVLACCEKPQRISAVSRGANMPHSRLAPMLEHLAGRGLIMKEEHSDPTYMTTELGRKFLVEYKRFLDLCGAYAIKP